MSEHRMFAMLRKALKVGGDTHSLEDLLIEIKEGKKQSFVLGDTWVVTQIIEYPKKKVVTIFLVVGDGKHLDALHDIVVDFANSVGATELHAFGRPGWVKYAEHFGFKPTTTMYVKEL